MRDYRAYPRRGVDKRQIVTYQYGRVWIGRARSHYTVFIDDVIIATADSRYPLTVEGFHCAVARCDYLGARLGK